MIKIGISSGDCNGVGPEVTVKALSGDGVADLFTPVWYIDKATALKAMEQFGENLPKYAVVKSGADAVGGRINIVDIKRECDLQPGTTDSAAGLAAVAALEAAAADLHAGKIDALVTAPISKEACRSEKFPFSGHTEWLESKAREWQEPKSQQSKTATSEDTEATDSSVSRVSTEGNQANEQAPKAQMILFDDTLRVALVTTHLPISEIPQALTKEKIESAIISLANTLRRDFAIMRPRIAVLALNPHAGDGGILGHEEENIISPAIEACIEKGFLAFGPYAADGFFGSGSYRKFDGILAMYHDQGLAPFKTIASTAGVNYTAGLPFVRTSPDHGTAFDIAWKGEADPKSMREAIYNAIDIKRRRDVHDSAASNPLKTHVSERPQKERPSAPRFPKQPKES